MLFSMSQLNANLKVVACCTLIENFVEALESILCAEV